MTFSMTWPAPLFVPGVLLLLASCSGPAPAGDDGGSGGANTNGSGGAQQGSGGTRQGTGGDTDGGSGGSVSGSGGRGDLASNECSDAYGCVVGATCYEPGAPPPVICGAPQWCGQCSCPTMPVEPEGLGQSCNDSTPCPSVSETVLRAASVCNPEMSQCAECISDEDCSDSLPHCWAGVCFQCAGDEDCSEEFPFCRDVSGQPGETVAGACRECRTTADCEAGVCNVEGACTPACENDAQCGPNRVCGAEERCVPQPCQADGECSEQSSCSDQSCRANSCTSDAACPGGYCVGGACYETPGACHFDTAG